MKPSPCGLKLQLLYTVMLTVLLLPWRGDAASPPARARAKPPGNPWVVILASTPERKEAEAQLASMREAKAFTWLKPAEGFPKIVESASLPGLSPNLHVLVLGVCGSKEAALSARARVLPMVDDAYVKQLTGPATLACPRPVNLESKLPKGAEQLVSVPFEKEKALVLTVHRVARPPEMECETSDLLIRLLHGREVLAAETLEGGCVGACTPHKKERGERQLAEIRERIEAGEGSESELDYNFTECISLTPVFRTAISGLGRPVLVVSTEFLGHHDVVYPIDHLLGVGCGEFTMSDTYDGSSGRSLSWYSAGLQVHPTEPGGATWKQFALTERSPGDAASKGQKVIEARWDGCSWALSEDSITGRQ